MQSVAGIKRTVQARYSILKGIFNLPLINRKTAQGISSGINLNFLLVSIFLFL